jgi:EAL domain-containing protein (putative c-di-GMP-specific phosphodiesterase class I)/GGDEF domain-containing protein
MTLFKQIALLVTLVFLILASVIVINDLSRTREFMQGQLHTTAQDMATTLGIVISNLPESDDPATLEVLFNAVFDSGYYSSIELVSVDNQSIQKKSQQVSVEGVPDWFISLIPLQQAQGSTQVMKGWTQLGRLEITMHPGFAYNKLYTTLISTIKWFGLIFLMALILLWLVLQYLLLPLKRVMEQADAIQNNRFVQQETLPRTIDLKRVVEAMNNMVSKVQVIFNDQQESLIKYQKLLYNDKVTNLGNRQYLMDQLQQATSEQSQFHGSLAIIRLVNYEIVRERLGYEFSDSLIIKLAQLLGDESSLQSPARLNDDEFAFLFAADEESVQNYLQQLFGRFRDQNEVAGSEIELFLIGGIAAIDGGSTAGEILSGIDYCLTQADGNGPWSIERRASNQITSLPQGKMQWRQWLENTIASQRLFMVGQLVKQPNGQNVHRELYIRARDESGQVLPASAFMPMASSLGMSIDIDKAVFEIIADIQPDDEKLPFAVNLSAAFFEQADAQYEFDQLLTQCQSNRVGLCIEASHTILAQHVLMCQQLAQRVHQSGHQIGIDHLDISQSLELLKLARFDYVKINAKTLHDISQNEVSAGYRALKTLTDTMNIAIIAVGVDSRELHDELIDLGIQNLQGNYLHEPQSLS